MYVRRNYIQFLCDMFNCSLKILISQGHHIHLEELRGTFSFLQPFRYWRCLALYTSVPQLSALQLILALWGMRSFVFYKVVPYLFYLHGFICLRPSAKNLSYTLLPSTPQPWEGTPYNGYTLRLLPKAVHSSGFLGILIRGQEFHMMRYMKQKGNLVWDI